jgi:hypothetical protein
MVPAERAWLLWDVDLAELEVGRDARYVTSRVLEHGRLADVRWLVAQYGLDGSLTSQARESLNASVQP